MKLIAEGRIEGHEARGDAKLLLTGPDQLRLELSELWVAPGAPDVRLYLSPYLDSHIDDTVMDLGHLPDRVATFAIDLPAGSDAAAVRSVIIYCKLHSILFGHGVLTPSTPI